MYYRIHFDHGVEYWREAQRGAVGTIYASCKVSERLQHLIINDRGVVTDATRRELIGQAPRIETVEYQQVVA